MRIMLATPPGGLLTFARELKRRVPVERGGAPRLPEGPAEPREG